MLRNCVICGDPFETRTRATRCAVHRTEEAKIKERQEALKESTALKAAGLGRKPKNKGGRRDPALPTLAGPLYFKRFDR
jgi:hypothetical protein